MSKNHSQKIRQYAIAFLVSTFVFYIMADMVWFESVRQVFLDFFASISSTFLSILGYRITAKEGIVTFNQFSVSIEEGCDALAPFILFSLATLLYPATWSYRIKGWLIGLAALFLLNVIRIVSLFIIGIHAPIFFDIMLVDIWQVLFIVVTAAFWMYWVSRSPKSVTHE